MKYKIKITKRNWESSEAWWNSRIGDIIEATEEKRPRRFLVKLEPGVTAEIQEGYCEIVRATTFEEAMEGLPDGMRGLTALGKAAHDLADYILEFYLSDPYVSLDSARIKQLLEEYGDLKAQKPKFDQQLEDYLQSESR